MPTFLANTPVRCEDGVHVAEDVDATGGGVMVEEDAEELELAPAPSVADEADLWASKGETEAAGEDIASLLQQLMRL